LIGNGWLREAPRHFVAREWDVKSRSALRKCMFMQLPPHLAAIAAAMPRPSAPPVQAWRPIRTDDAPVHRHIRNPAKDARMMPAVPAVRPAPLAMQPSAREWWEDPFALGALLICVPPIGLACVWNTSRYSSDARWALTVMTTLMMAIAGAITLALILR
jgi:hypothetical protein